MAASTSGVAPTEAFVDDVGMIRCTFVIAVALVLPGCTSLGAVPITHGGPTYATPNQSADVSSGLVPGFLLSDATRRSEGVRLGSPAATMAVSGQWQVKPGHWLRVGGRVFAAGDEGIVPEPQLSYLSPVLAERVTVGLGIAGTWSSGESKGASFDMARVSIESTIDVELGNSAWMRPHLFAATNLQVISADGAYCWAADGVGEDCADEFDIAEPAQVSGVYPGVTLGTHFHWLPGLVSMLHGFRTTAMVSVATAPHLVAGQANGRKGMYSIGVLVGFPLGAKP